MAMPVLPGMQQKQGKPGPFTDLLDELPPEALEAIVESAQEWSDAGEPPMVGDDPDATVETDMDTPAEEPLPGDNPVPHDETTETPEEEAAETPDEEAEEQQAGAENIEGLQQQIQQVADQAAGYVEQFDALVEQAKEAEEQGGDPDAVEDLKDQAADYAEEVAKMMKEVDAAAKDEDAEGMATQGLAIEKHCQIIEQLLQQAQTHAGGHLPPAPAAGSIQKTPALSLWAQRYNGK